MGLIDRKAGWLVKSYIEAIDLTDNADTPVIDLELCKEVLFDGSDEPPEELMFAGIYLAASNIRMRLTYDELVFKIRSKNIDDHNLVESEKLLKAENLEEAMKSFCDELWLSSPLTELVQKKITEIPAAYAARGYGSWQ